MNYGLTQLVEPQVEPLDVPEVLRHLNLYDDTDTPYIENLLIPSARQRAEKESDRQLITATWQLSLPRFPSGVILLPKGRIQSVEEVAYVDVAGEDQVLDETEWRLLADREPGEVEPVKYWPATAPRRRSAVTVKFKVGYGDEAESVPQLLRAGMLLAIGHWYENRAEVVTGTIASAVPKSATDIFEQHRIGDDYLNYETGL